MRAKLLLVAVFVLTGCGLIWTPTMTVKAFLSAAQRGDADSMTKLFSEKAIQNIGLDKVRSNNQSFSEMVKQATAAQGKYRMENVQETSIPTGKRVSFFYKNESNTDSLKLVFDLSQEGSAWKIDEIGGAEKGETGFEQPAQRDTLSEPIPPAPSPEKDQVASASPNNSQTKRSTINGGVLNGKAISLPQPAYPPLAKATKASGTVVVQVVVDENGDVIEAHAVSGHPLLQAVSVAAARGVKFSPTKLSGQPVKVTGVIVYKFVSP